MKRDYMPFVIHEGKETNYFKDNIGFCFLEIFYSQYYINEEVWTRISLCRQFDEDRKTCHTHGRNGSGFL
jgi:hypothetical protein